MPVGTGSINRAARNSKKVAETAKIEKAVVKPEETAVAAEPTAAAEPAEKKTAEKKPAEKKPSAVKKATTSKKTAPKKAASVKTPAPEKEATAPELRVYGNETVFIVGNECCHLTEELPVHLL